MASRARGGGDKTTALPNRGASALHEGDACISPIVVQPPRDPRQSKATPSNKVQEGQQLLLFSKLPVPDGQHHEQLPRASS